jgi:hypothetical protein
MELLRAFALYSRPLKLGCERDEPDCKNVRKNKAVFQRIAFRTENSYLAYKKRDNAVYHDRSSQCSRCFAVYFLGRFYFQQFAASNNLTD